MCIGYLPLPLFVILGRHFHSILCQRWFDIDSCSSSVDIVTCSPFIQYILRVWNLLVFDNLLFVERNKQCTMYIIENCPYMGGKSKTGPWHWLGTWLPTVPVQTLLQHSIAQGSTARIVGASSYRLYHHLYCRFVLLNTVEHFSIG